MGGDDGMKAAAVGVAKTCGAAAYDSICDRSEAVSACAGAGGGADETAAAMCEWANGELREAPTSPFSAKSAIQ